ncbi:MAG: hypothetical protein D6692_10475 [Planctomycetota bacterium]|nr:MAG: hypothetical protein D6692_10475 [Planctomycetota bacterium]
MSERTYRIGSWIANVLGSLAVALSIHLIGALRDMDRRLTVVETSQWTSTRAVELAQEVATLKAELAALPKQNPPQWFVDRVDRLEASIDRQLGALREQIAAVARSADAREARR